MGSFGDKLKREREMRGITLEEISEATKIGTRSLRALEEEHFDQLPGGIFNKGFVRSYAKFLGLDEEQAVADYVTATNEVGTSTQTQMQALAEEADRKRAIREAAQGGGTGGMMAAVIAIVVIAGIGFGGFKAWQFKKSQRETIEAVQAAPRKQAPPPVQVLTAATNDTTATSTDATATTLTPTASTTAAVPAANSAATPGTSSAPPASSATPAATAPKTAATDKKPEFAIVVSIKATKKAWVKVTADGKTIYQDQMDPDIFSKKEVALHANDKMSMVIGNAGGIELVVNGKPAGTLGSDGQTRSLTITPEGIQR